MPKIGRNQFCPCGSGKKFKKCHGLTAAQQMTTRSPVTTKKNHQTPSPSIEVDITGVAGLQHYLIARPHYADPNDPRNAGDIGGMPGKYKVVFTLSRPGFPLRPELKFSAATDLKGDSHIAIAKPALKFSGGEEFNKIKYETITPFGQFLFVGYPNDEGFLGKIEAEEFEADNFDNAGSSAYQALAPALSNMSLYLDVPLYIYQIDVTELRTGSIRMSAKTPFKIAPGVVPPRYRPSEEQRKYSSLYREALNSDSSNYQFLCLYKIIEGLRKRRSRLRKEAALDAKNRGEQPPQYPEEKLPEDVAKQSEWLNSLFPTHQKWDPMALNSVFISEAVGRKINNLIAKDGELHQLRNKIAHAVLDSGEPMISIDNELDIQKVGKWLPIIRCLARFLLKDAFPDLLNGTSGT